jgi:hypothetical protein
MADRVRASRTSVAVATGRISCMNAATPATIGARIDVPDMPPKCPPDAGRYDTSSSSDPTGWGGVARRAPCRDWRVRERPDLTKAPAALAGVHVPGIDMVKARLTKGSTNCAAVFR